LADVRGASACMAFRRNETDPVFDGLSAVSDCQVLLEVFEQFKGLHTLGISTQMLTNLELRKIISKSAVSIRHLSINFVVKV
jgi:hypothetical protein